MTYILIWCLATIVPSNACWLWQWKQIVITEEILKAAQWTFCTRVQRTEFKSLFCLDFTCFSGAHNFNLQEKLITVLDTLTWWWLLTFRGHLMLPGLQSSLPCSPRGLLPSFSSVLRPPAPSPFSQPMALLPVLRRKWKPSGEDSHKLPPLLPPTYVNLCPGSRFPPWVVCAPVISSTARLLASLIFSSLPDSPHWLSNRIISPTLKFFSLESIATFSCHSVSLFPLTYSKVPQRVVHTCCSKFLWTSPQGTRLCSLTPIITPRASPSLPSSSHLSSSLCLLTTDTLASLLFLWPIQHTCASWLFHLLCPESLLCSRVIHLFATSRFFLNRHLNSKASRDHLV